MKTVITEHGLEIIGQNGSSTTDKYWIGYYGLAYVPDEQRGDGQADQLSSNMTKLTTTGDNIYNLFQGSMKPEGFNTDIGDSAANYLYNECLYTGNLMSRFRYMIDPETDKNTLVVFSGHTDYYGREDGVQEYTKFDGVDMESASKLPIPAPLYYLGEPKDYDQLTDADVPVGFDVSCDTRSYSASDSTIPQPSLDSDSWSGADRYGWAKSEDNVYGNGGIEMLTKAWQFQSVSNYNRFHSPANAEGYAVGYDPACRNMAIATKLFPIGHYDVLSTRAGEEKVGKVQYTVEINMKSVFTEVANRTQVYYDYEGHKVSGDNYKMSFKFNRIGIYAVPVALHAYTDSEAQNTDNCANYNVQMQINGNHEPVLFAVMDLDSPVVMSEDGVLEYKFNFNVDFGDESKVVDSSSIYYNLYEDDAITWYKNQLIANASAANAITSLEVQMAYLRKQVNKLSPGSMTGCTVNDKGNTYLYTGTTLKNIVDVGSFGITSPSWRDSLIIGDSTGIGNDSQCSISVGSKSCDMNTSFNYSMVNTCDNSFRQSQSVIKTLLGSIWWGYSSRVLTLDTENDLNVLKDVFVFLGTHSSGYVGPEWLGIDKSMEKVGSELQTYTMQPYDAPMIFTGGIALGGHGNHDAYGYCNYGLLKLGTNTKKVSTQTELLEPTNTSIVMVTTVDPEMEDHIVTVNDYTYLGVQHQVVQSPHAGKVLTVLPEQELDGTLHIGLGNGGGSANIIDVGYIKTTAKDPETGEIYPDPSNPPSNDYLDTLDEIFGSNTAPVVCYSFDNSYKPPNNYHNACKGRYAHLCSVGYCEYNFYDATCDLYIQFDRDKNVLACYNSEP